MHLLSCMIRKRTAFVGVRTRMGGKERSVTNGYEWVWDLFPILISLAAFLAALIAVLKSYSSDRPFLTAVLPFEATEEMPFKVNNLRFGNDGKIQR